MSNNTHKDQSFNPSPTDLATSMIAQAENDGDWPVKVDTCKVTVPSPTGSGTLYAPNHHAVVATYRGGREVVKGINGGRYTATKVEQWHELVHAACAAGATPVMSHSSGGKVLAQFDVSGNGIRTNLVLGDSFDGSTKLVAGLTAVRTACANTLAVMISKGKDWTKIRHTASLETKVNMLLTGMAEAAKEGASVQALFDRAARVALPASAAKAAFDAFFPEAVEGASRKAKTRAENMRAAARIAAAMECNDMGGINNLGTMWNAATYLVDRREDGTDRTARGGADQVESMLFGSRGKRVEQVRHLVNVIMADGRVEEMTVAQATDAGVPASNLGSGLIEAMLNEAGMSN